MQTKSNIGALWWIDLFQKLFEFFGGKVLLLRGVKIYKYGYNSEQVLVRKLSTQGWDNFWIICRCILGGKPSYKMWFQTFVPKFEHEVHPIVTSQMQENFTPELVAMNCFMFSWILTYCVLLFHKSHHDVKISFIISN